SSLLDGITKLFGSPPASASAAAAHVHVSHAATVHRCVTGMQGHGSAALTTADEAKRRVKAAAAVLCNMIVPSFAACEKGVPGRRRQRSCKGRVRRSHVQARPLIRSRLSRRI